MPTTPTTSTPSAEAAPQARGRYAAAWRWGPAAAALAVRLVLYAAGGLWAAGPADPVVVQGDAIEYHLLARALTEDSRFAFDAADPVAQRRTVLWEVEPLRTPGYPAFVAVAYALAGPRPGLPIALGLLLDAAVCLVLATALRGALGVRGAGLAALAYALHPGAALFSNLLYREALFTFLAVVGFVVLDGAIGAAAARRAAGRAAAAGLLFGLATLVRPVLQFFPFAVALFLLVVPGRRWGRAAALTLVFAAAFALPLLPWVLRNDARHGHAALSTSGAFNLAALYAAPAAGEPPGAVLAGAEAAARRDGVPLRTALDRAPAGAADAGAGGDAGALPRGRDGDPRPLPLHGAHRPVLGAVRRRRRAASPPAVRLNARWISKPSSSTSSRTSTPPSSTCRRCCWWPRRSQRWATPSPGGRRGGGRRSSSSYRARTSPGGPSRRARRSTPPSRASRRWRR